MTAATLMSREAAEAPQAVARQIAANEALCRELGARLRGKPPRMVVTCARGSSDSAATFAKYLIEIRFGIPVASIGPSISSVYGIRPKLQDALFLAVSQSGRSPDLLSLTEAARAEGALTVALVGDAESPLARCSEIVMPLHAGPEIAVAATKSYIGALAAVLHLCAHWIGEPEMERVVQALPDALAQAHGLDWSAAEPLIGRSRNLFVIGRGPSYATAQEVALKFKETCGIHAEAYSAAELMHGPLALAGPDFPVLALSQDDASLPGMRTLIDGLIERKVPVIAAGPVSSCRGVTILPTVPGLNALAQPIALVQSFYPMVDRIARSLGQDPDRPPHLRKVTETL